ncbi:MAG: sortase, partial [Chloroflexi bacterium]|nr:sortase [Chloroflexota bacterium]
SETPGPTPSGDASPTPAPADRTATRVVVGALGIDLPVIKQPDPSYPACDVAMYINELGQPGEGRATYLYAHAQKGMFLPILNASKVNNGAAMLGMIVEVYTSDDRLFLYEVTEVRRHQVVLTDAVNATTEQMWLQTSEGARQPPGVVGPKTQVVAMPLSEGPADHEDAHPVPRPRDCG